MRNYVHDANNKEDFSTLYPDMTAGNSATVIGLNSTFTRTETISSADHMKLITVAVNSTDASGEAQRIALDTEIAYLAPGTPGRTGGGFGFGGLETPTGRARVGEGRVPDGAPTTTNDDGTEYYDADGERKLAVPVEGYKKIVLTLEEACENETCISHSPSSSR